MGDLCAVDTKRKIYFYLGMVRVHVSIEQWLERIYIVYYCIYILVGDTSAGTTLVGLALDDGKKGKPNAEPS